jgi:hypothetical protein
MKNHPDFPQHDPFAGVNRGAATLPRLVKSLEDLDLDAELALLYSNANHLYTEVCTAIEIPANQKAQTLSTILAILKEVLKEKETLYNIGEVTLIETALGETLKKFPEVREAFLQEYRGNLSL